MPVRFEQHFNGTTPAIYKMYRELIRTRQQLYALTADVALRRSDKEPAFAIEFTSQFGEDLLCWDLLGRNTTGFFVEAGAFDGYRFSVSYAFEAVGWTGLLVEPHPAAYEACAARRLNSRVVHAALGGRDAGGETEFITAADPLGGMMSHLPGLGDRNVGGAETSVRVPFTTLNRLLDHHSGEVDLLVLDVEGAEDVVLADFDLERFRPRLMLIETATPAELVKSITPRGYLFGGTLEMNSILIREDQSEMIDRLRRLTQ